MWWLLLFLINLWSVALFQLIAAVCRDDTIATAVGSFFLLVRGSLCGEGLPVALTFGGVGGCVDDVWWCCYWLFASY